MTGRLAGIALVSMLAFTGSAHADTGQATLANQEGESVGTIELRSTKTKGVWLKVSLQNIAPGKHAFHIHETGTCEGDFKSAGGHYNPGDTKHGHMAEGGAHGGDLPNIDVPASGKLELELFTDGVSLAKDAKNTVYDADGSAFIIHAGADDYASQPSGDAGARIACGVIK